MDNCNSIIAWFRPEDSGNVNPLWAELQAGYLFVHFLEEEMVRSVTYTVHDMTGSSGTEKSRLVSSSCQEVYDWTLKMCTLSKDMCFLFKRFKGQPLQRMLPLCPLQYLLSRLMKKRHHCTSDVSDAFVQVT